MNDFTKYVKNRIKYKIYRFILFLIVATLIFYLGNKTNLLESKVYALETTAIYGSNTANGLGASGKFNYRDSATGAIKAGNLNTVYADIAYTLSFYIQKTTAVGKTYKIRLNFNDYDFYKGVNSSYVKIQTYNDDEPNPYCTIVNFTLVNQGGTNNQAKGVDIEYMCNNNGNVIAISMAKKDTNTDNYLRLTTINWRLNTVQWELVQTDGTQDIINNQTNNTQNIINNNNQNTQEIIDNQNENTQSIIDELDDNMQEYIESNKVCDVINKKDIILQNKVLNSSGNIADGNNWGITDYININGATITFHNYGFSTTTHTCFYKSDKTLISCQNNYTLEGYTPPTNSYYMRMTILSTSSLPYADVCKNGNQAIEDTNKSIWQSILDLPSTIGGMLQSLFIPNENDLNNALNTLKTWFEGKFGILAQLTGIVTNFIYRFMSIDGSQDVIINIPRIEVPNFEGWEFQPIIQETTFNWSELLRSKEPIYNLWQLYLTFVDVMIYISLFTFALNVYEGILGETHIPMSENNIYSSEGESYDVDDRTGELTNHRYWTKETRRL